MFQAQRPLLVTGPTETPVSLAAAKAHLRVEHGEDDILIAAMIAAAVSTIDGWSGWLGRCLVTQTWSRAFSGFPCAGSMLLPFPDASDVSVTYLPSGGGASVTLATSEWHHVRLASGDAVALADGATWPSTADHPAAVTLTADYGYGEAADVPAAIRSALLLMVGDLYRYRETATVGATAVSTPTWTTVQSLLAPNRFRFAA